MKLRAYLLGLLLAVLCLWVCGCSSTTMCRQVFPKQCGKTTPEVVYVTDYKPEDPLPAPDRPAESHNEVDAESSWREWLEAFTADYLRILAWGIEQAHIIQAHNDAIPPPPE